MNIVQASHYLLQKMKIRRSGWGPEDYLVNDLMGIMYIYKNKSHCFINVNKELEFYNFMCNELWEPSIEDLMADDWEIKGDK